MGEGEEGKEEWRKGREEKGKEKEEGRVGTTPIKKLLTGLVEVGIIQYREIFQCP